jgi:putative hydrolase of HD superfamily
MPDPPTHRLLDLLLQASRLKTIPRAGWAARGVPAPESVADHSHGTAIVALLLLERISEPLDRAKVLAMAVLHDLPECEIGDLTTAAVRHLPAGAKTAAEASAMAELLDGLPFDESWRGIWREYVDQGSPEARLVRDADRLEMLLQALVYERTTGHRGLDEFWEHVPAEGFAFEPSQNLARALLSAREARER